MKVSKQWLQEYIEEKLPSTEKLVEAFVMHVFEVEGIEKAGDDDVIDVKVLPDRAHYALSHYGVASEVAAILGLTLKPEKAIPQYPESKELKVAVRDTKMCRRYTGALIKGVKVGPSPTWLKEKLEAIGQRSINTIVDATNYVMFSIGQPLHAFDAKKITYADGQYELAVQRLVKDECLIALDEKSYDLKEGTLVVADGKSDRTLAIAGIKGGSAAAVKENTTDLILEAGNWDPVLVRKTGRALGLITDAQKRFENELTPELAMTGLSHLIELIKEVAGGDLEGVVDIYPKPVKPYKVGVSLPEINTRLGAKLTEKEVSKILTRLNFVYAEVVPNENVPKLAQSLLGKPYAWGASVLYDAPEKFDCSSLTSYLYKESGVQIPRVVVDQYVWGKEITQEELQPGDLIFSKTLRKENPAHTETVDFMKGTPVAGGISHVGIYMGDGKVIHAADGKGVVEETISDSTHFKEIVGYRRMAAVGEKRWCVTAPAVRLDLRIREDLIEEIGRIYGYDRIVANVPGKQNDAPLSKYFFYIHKIKNILKDLGFSEVYTYAFADTGEVEVANPMASDKGFLRTALTPAISKSLEFNLKNADLLGLDQIKLFEIGKVFKKDTEYTSLCIGIANVKGFKNKNLEKDEQTVNGEIRWTRETLWEKLGANVQTLCTIDDTGGILVIKGKAIGEVNKVDGVMELNLAALIAAMPDVTAEEAEASSFQAGGHDGNAFHEDASAPSHKFRAISPYPFIVRDIAVFVPGEQSDENQNKVLDIIKKEGTDLMVTYRLFDVFTKKKEGEETRTSYGYRMVFQASDRTLTDDEANSIMQKMTDAMNSNAGWQVR